MGNMSAPTYTKDVAPILQKHCQSCHRPGEAAPFSMLTYEQTRPWAGAMKVAVRLKTMPPWYADPQIGHFSNDGSLSQKDIDTIVE
jgi:mono/diheme cytochrome c family protein